MREPYLSQQCTGLGRKRENRNCHNRVLVWAGKGRTVSVTTVCWFGPGQRERIYHNTVLVLAGSERTVSVTTVYRFGPGKREPYLLQTVCWFGPGKGELYQQCTGLNRESENCICHNRVLVWARKGITASTVCWFGAEGAEY